MPLYITAFTGQAITPWLDAVARLRIEVFRDFPYLYDGDLHYEQHYLTRYAESPHSLFVLAIDGDQVVGASTAIALSDAEKEFQAPFIIRGIPLEQVLYFGESILQAAYRGRGLGHRFFDEREAFARQLGKTVTAFCAVERPAEHCLRPSTYSPLDTFWTQRGYRKQPDMQINYAWQDIDQREPSLKPMVFWMHNPLIEKATGT
jgi:GNAT superfamily N-acetyltransferase